MFQGVCIGKYLMIKVKIPNANKNESYHLSFVYGALERTWFAVFNFCFLLLAMIKNYMFELYF